MSVCYLGKFDLRIVHSVSRLNIVSVFTFYVTFYEFMVTYVMKYEVVNLEEQFFGVSFNFPDVNTLIFSVCVPPHTLSRSTFLQPFVRLRLYVHFIN